MDRLCLILTLLFIGCGGPDASNDDIIRQSNCADPRQPAVVIAGQSNANVPVWEYQGAECLIVYSAPGRSMESFNERDMMNWIDAHPNPVKLFVWFQGESDALDIGLADSYGERMDRMLSGLPWPSCASVVSVPDRPYNCKVRCAQLEWPCVIDTVDLERGPDKIHLTYQSKVDYLEILRVIADPY